LSASVYSQSTKLSLEMRNAKVGEVLDAIESQSEFRFAYSPGYIDLNREVTVDIREKTIDESLKVVFAGTNVEFGVFDRHILLYPESMKPGAETLVSHATGAQQRSVSGNITDSGGQPLPGVTVVVKGTTRGTVTNNDGKYTLRDIPEDATLVFSFVGMKTQEIVVGNQTSINVTMIEDAIGLEEVVAIGYGTQKKETVTGSVSAVKGEQLAKSTVANVSNSLAGQLPGLISKQSSGMPGRDAATLSIRGFGNALVIVDGIEANISTLDPNSIESVSILKDGAASIYGARAGNGVILVTTKRGKDSKPTISLNTTFSLQGLTKFPDKASSGQYTEMMSERAINSGTTIPYTPEQIQNYYNEVDPYLFPNTDWEDVLLRTWAPQQQHNLSVRGGSDKIKYYGFIGYLNQETMFKNNGGEFSRIHLQSNIDAQITDQLSAQFDFASINEISLMPQQSLFGVSAQGGTVWDHYWSDLPIYPAKLPDPTKYSYNGQNGQTHILSDREIFGHNDEIKNDVRATLSLKYEFKFVKGLSAKAFFNARQIYREFEFFQKPADYYTFDPTNSTYTRVGGFSNKALMNQSRNTDRVLTGQFSLNYDRIINNDHHIRGLALYEAIDYSGNNLSAARTDFLTPAVEQLFAGSSTTMSNNGSGYEMGRKSIVARANYSYKNKYLLESSLRADASAKFPEESRWGYFPSVSMGWIMTEEGFMEDSGALEYLKLRGSYGQSGNDAVGNFQYLAGYVYGLTNVFNIVEQGIVSTGLANPNLTWEEISIANMGFDFSLWKRKLYGEADAFYRTREGIIGNRLTTLPSTFGAALPPENLNSTSDRGFELKLGTAGDISDFRYDISANVSWSRAKWDYFEEPIYEDPEQTRVYTKTGRWIDRMYGYISEGLFASKAEIDALTYDQDGRKNNTLRPGDIRYKDINEDGKIDWMDQVEIGNGNTPHWMYGFDFNLSYKNFDLSGIMQGAAGYHARVNMIFISAENFNNRWTEENNNLNAIVPRLGGAATNNWGSDHNFKSAAYLRLKSINFGYNLPRYLLDKAGFEQCRIYVAGANLLTFDKLKEFGMDPEAPTGYSGLYYPQQRIISFGINLTL
jgi:TonB-linked SusC/RagA family outer membrane protein